MEQAEPSYVASFVVVLPVKPPAFGKSRLRGLGAPDRTRLAEAFALDTATACLGAARVAEVLVATDDASLAGRLRALGCATVPDGATSGLNPALRQAAAEAARRWPALAAVALCADLPALRSGDLDDALAAARPGSAWFVADAQGTGTTTYVGNGPAGFDPCFGVDSATAHLASGARPLAAELKSLRRDVDDLDDLRAATRLGLGAATALLVTELDLG